MIQGHLLPWEVIPTGGLLEEGGGAELKRTTSSAFGKDQIYLTWSKRKRDSCVCEVLELNYMQAIHSLLKW